MVIKPGAGDEVQSAADDVLVTGLGLLLPGYVFTEGEILSP